MAARDYPQWQTPEPDLDELPPPPGSRAAGADPHDVMGHAVNYEGQDCPSCREQFNRETETDRW